MTEVDICASGELWVGDGVRSFEGVTHDALNKAHERVILTCYSITGGAGALLEELNAALERGVLVHLIVNKLAQQKDAPTAVLSALVHRFPHFHLWSFDGDDLTDLHSKLVCVDSSFAIIGSSNMSFRGLVANYELGVIVRGPTAAALESKVMSMIAAKVVRRIM
jgi:phosphatidylserine/phosphatidylglycerophosphate/cardiolipin synthase-like enzyme